MAAAGPFRYIWALQCVAMITALIEPHFCGPIHIGADRDALEVLTTVASRANRLSDDGMSKFFETHLDTQLVQINDTSELERRILDQIGEAYSEGVPTLAVGAGRLGMSARNLQRRLSADGLAYQDMVLDARKSLSKHLLRRTDYALAEIAFLTGFTRIRDRH